MKKPKLSRFPALVFTAALAVAAALPGQDMHADMVLLNGKVITVDASDRIAQAVAISNGKIVAVGTNAEVSKFAGPGTQRVDLKGLAVTPGLIDSHAHFSTGGADRLYSLDLSYPEVRNISHVLAKLAAQAAKLPEWRAGNEFRAAREKQFKP